MCIRDSFEAAVVDSESSALMMDRPQRSNTEGRLHATRDCVNVNQCGEVQEGGASAELVDLTEQFEEEGEQRSKALRDEVIYMELKTVDAFLRKAVRERMESVYATARIGVRLYFDEASRSYFEGEEASDCVDTIRYLEQAIDVCEYAVVYNLEYLVLKHEIRALCRKVRDSLIIRVQLHASIGDKEEFEQKLAAAFGKDDVADGQSGDMGTSVNMYSLLMQSYRKQIWERFPVEAFASLSRKQNEIRGKPRPERRPNHRIS